MRDLINILEIFLVKSEMTRLWVSVASCVCFRAQNARGFFVGIWELFLLAVGVSMDAFAVSICKGLAMKKATLKAGLTCGLWFGGFQALMPLIGFFLGTLFADAIQAVDHWVAFVLLAIIGVNMLKEALEKQDECGCCECQGADMSVKTMFVMAVATSIDALAAGVGMSVDLSGMGQILFAVISIGVITFGLSALGVKIGNVFGAKYKFVAELLGGVVLVGMGLKILIEHLFLA